MSADKRTELDRMINQHEDNCLLCQRDECDFANAARAELASLRKEITARRVRAELLEAELQAAQARIAGLKTMVSQYRANQQIRKAAMDDMLAGTRVIMDAQAQEIIVQARQLAEAREYLTEWRSTPFFESHDEWEKWARNLAMRVDAWLAANAPIEAG